MCRREVLERSWRTFLERSVGGGCFFSGFVFLWLCLVAFLFWILGVFLFLSCGGMLGKNVGDECCGEVSERSVVEKGCGEVLQGSVVKECGGEVLW